MRLDLRVVRPDTSRVLWMHILASLVRHRDGTPSHVTVVVESRTTRRL